MACRSGKELAYLQELPAVRQSVFSELSGFGDSAKDFDIRVENKKVGAGVRVTGDKPREGRILRPARTTLCPSSHRDESRSGREFTWRLTYDFYTLN